ncbi:MAG: NeuD/PglB/VioB family sugar acetyltransferase, partial [Colwellia sp.]
KKLILLGGGGHCRSCIDVIDAEQKYQIVGVLDKFEDIGTDILGYKVIGEDRDILTYIEEGCFFLITVGHLGNRDIRNKLFSFLAEHKAKLASIVSPNAYVSNSAKIGAGTIVMHGAIVNALAKIEENCIINTRSLIEHDCVIRAHSHISTGAVINGGVEVSEGTFFGSNSVSKQSVKTVKNDFIKAGTCFSGHNPRIAFLSTIFDMDAAFLRLFLKSLTQQTYKEFDLIILNDGYKGFEKLKDEFLRLRIIELPPADSIAKNRQNLINYTIKNGYDIAIFGDSDDHFPKNRVSTSIRLLKECDIIVNDLSAFNCSGFLKENILSRRLKDLDDIDPSFIMDKNVFGMTNTALNLAVIREGEVKFSSDLIAVDWYFFSRLLKNGANAIFTDQTVTYYRQHKNNTVGIASNSPDSISLAIDVKEIHYSEMALEHTEYQPLYKKIIDLKGKIRLNDDFIVQMQANNEYYPDLLWWELKG